MHIFLGLPISGPLSESEKNYRTAYLELVQEILTILRKNDSNTVFCALEAEKWGAELWEPEKAARRDFVELRKADIVMFFYPKRYISSLLIELGWATALDKKCLVFQHESIEPIYLLEGLSAIAHFELQTYRDKDELLLKVSQLV